MNTLKTLVLLVTLFILLISCEENKAPATETTEEISDTTTEVAPTEEEEVPLTIFQNSFLTISPGNQIAEHKAVIEEDLLQTGEGDFEIYNIKDQKNKVVAYFLADPMDNEIIGDIYITSRLAQTEDGIGIGHTFGDLLTKYPDLEVHGSEIESQTFANLGSLSFKLDEPHVTYDLEISAVSKEAKILEIVIKR
jgi:hypothetical protein